MKKKTAPRVAAAQILMDVLEKKESLTEALVTHIPHVPPIDQGFCKAICFGVLRHLPYLEWKYRTYLPKPLSKKHKIIEFLLMSGLYQLRYQGLPAHAVVNESVSACRALGFPYLTGLLNAVLRRLAMTSQTPDNPPEGSAQHLHPQWFFDLLLKSYPLQTVQKILTANNKAGDMWLRINLNKISRDAFQARLKENGLTSVCDTTIPSAIKLTPPVQVESIPGFLEGLVSVQDLSAQRCAYLLNLKERHTYLDLCAAPGGKLAHFLELSPLSKAIAIEKSEKRIEHLRAELRRLNLEAQVVCLDGRDAQKHFSNCFDRILVDAPCSGSGVIRRHPDAKWLKKASDLPQWLNVQHELLDSAWACLQPGGLMLYTTCSVFEIENTLQVKHFLEKHADSNLESIPEMSFHGQLQTLPEENGGDGFFYALFRKKLT